MERKNSILMWRVRDVFIFILSIVGLALLLVYGSKAISAANDRRYVEGLRKHRPFVEMNDTMAASSPPSVLSHVIPLEQAVSENSSANSSDSSISSKSELPAVNNPGQKNGLLKNELPELSKGLLR